MPADADARMAESSSRSRTAGAGIGTRRGARGVAQVPGGLGARGRSGDDAALAFWRAVAGEATGGDYVR